jgi:hypothetical protein
MKVHDTMKVPDWFGRFEFEKTARQRRQPDSERGSETAEVGFVKGIISI